MVASTANGVHSERMMRAVPGNSAGLQPVSDERYMPAAGLGLAVYMSSSKSNHEHSPVLECGFKVGR